MLAHSYPLVAIPPAYPLGVCGVPTVSSEMAKTTITATIAPRVIRPMVPPIKKNLLLETQEFYS